MQELNSQIANRLNFNYLDKTLASDSFDDSFHLPKSVSAIADLYKCETESIASSATSKRRIDMLFGDTQSVSSEYHINHRIYKLPAGRQRKVKSLIEGGVCIDVDSLDKDGDIGDHFYQEPQQQPTAQNEVQVQIEKMFSEISSSELEMKMQPASSCCSHKIFTIQHLGSIPVQGKILSIEGLQQPIKELFFKYQNQGIKKKNANGVIQIGDKGLQIEYCSNDGGQIKKMYPFSNIAIWASLKFSHRTTSPTNDIQQYNHEYAFLPIVPNSDKSSLYTPLDQHLVHHFVNTDNNVPLLAVVMRKPDTLVKQLVCHGFVCNSCEDALIIAATLYRILMGKMGKTQAAKSQIQQRQPTSATAFTIAVSTAAIRLAAPNQLCSIGEMSPNKCADSEGNNYAQVEKHSTALAVAAAVPPSSLPPLPTPPPPTRPPRRLKQLSRQGKSSSDGDALRLAAALASERPDGLTKITIPHSSSFSNTNRLSSRYVDPLSHKAEAITAVAASPLGLVEMLNKLQSQEGLKTVDEILHVIVKSEGMSFNELKPIYKEFVLKLALVLSKDELYHRSKAIMKSQQKTYNASSSSLSCLNKVITTKAGLKNIFGKPLVKLLMRKSPKGGACSSCQKYSDDKICDDEIISTDSFMLTEKPRLHQEHLKRQRPQVTVAASSSSLIGKASGNVASIRQKPFRFRSQQHHQCITSTSDDSDYPNVDRRKFKNKSRDEDDPRPSSSGYYSCSECSYDTESCTCVSADKCYCSLRKNRPLMARAKPKTYYSPCSGDKIAYSKRDECYYLKQQQQQQFHRQQRPLSLVEPPKQKGFVVSGSSLSPDDINQRTPTKDRTYTKLSKSLEYLESDSRNYQTRMQLYNTEGHKEFGCPPSHQYGPSYLSKNSRTSQKRSVSSNNLAVDYSMFAKSDERISPEMVIGGGGDAFGGFAYRSSKRMSVRKQNVVSAELAGPKLSSHGGTSPIDQNNAMSSRLMPPAQMKAAAPSRLNGVYPHIPMSTGNCACACSIFTGDPFSTYKSMYGSTPFGGMNMENIFGYFP